MNENEEDKFEDVKEERVAPTVNESANVRIIEAVVNPKNIIQRIEMSDVPKGKQGRKRAIFLAQELILEEMKARREPNHKRVGYGTLALIALATIDRGSERRFIGEMIQFKTIENEKDTTNVNVMGGS